MAINQFDESYMAQLRLVVRILPAITRNGAFALKGGTAINLFEHGLPRLSVDIDLCYPYFSERTEALDAIVDNLASIRQDLSIRIPGIKFANLGVASQEYKLLCRTPEALVKIEVNTTMRGHAFPIRTMPMHPDAEEILGQYMEMPVISREELYGGKICAALDRQHPRDLFDLAPFLSGSGFDRRIVLGFIVCLLSHNRPIHELLAPNVHDMRDAFDNQFAGMSATPFAYEDYARARETLFVALPALLSEADRKFLRSFVKGVPDWNLLEVPDIARLPAVLWKLRNIDILKERSPRKYDDQYAILCEVLK
jgi:Domain of unknown function (DUF1814).